MAVDMRSLVVRNQQAIYSDDYCTVYGTHAVPQLLILLECLMVQDDVQYSYEITVQYEYCVGIVATQ